MMRLLSVLVYRRINTYPAELSLYEVVRQSFYTTILARKSFIAPQKTKIAAILLAVLEARIRC